MADTVDIPPLTSASERFDERRFRELVLHVAHELRDDDRFGDTKLNKALCFCDFWAFQRLGHTLTGAEYQRQPRGPVARPLLRVREDMVRTGEITVTREPVHAYHRRVTHAERAADLSVFAGDERAIIVEVLAFVRPHDGASISEVSHRLLAGWRIMRDGETIPPETALVSSEPPNPARRAHFAELAAEHLAKHRA